MALGLTTMRSGANVLPGVDGRRPCDRDFALDWFGKLDAESTS